MDQLVDDYCVDFTRVPRSATYGGVIVETRCHPFLPLVVKNFVHMLPTWGLTIFHVKSNYQYINDFLGPNHGVDLIELDVPSLTVDQYSRLLMTKEFYQMIPYPTFLIFQCDSYLRSGEIEPYLDYDYVGALWPDGMSPVVDTPHGPYQIRVGNGGLSLRKKKACLEILSLPEMDDYRHYPEDVFFAIGIHFLPHANKCPEHIAGSFSVENVYHPDPLGWHRAYDYLPREEWDVLKERRLSK